MAWNRPGGVAKPTPKKKPNALRGVVAGVAVVLLGCILAVVFWAGESKDPSKKGKKTPIAEVKPSARSDRRTLPQATRSVASGEVRSLRQESDTTTETQAPDVAATNVPEKSMRKSGFKHGTDRYISMAMGLPYGARIPPLPTIGRGATTKFLESLKEPIEISENDSDHVKAVKEAVQNAREEIAQVIQENPGMSLSDVLEEYRKNHNEDLDVRSKTMAELRKIIDEGDIEGARKFRTIMNVALQQIGIEEMDVPITDEEKAAAAAREEAEDSAQTE